MAVKKRSNVEDAAVTLEGLLASAKQVIGEQGWTGVDDGAIEAAIKASYLKFAKSDQDAFMEFLVSALFTERATEDTLNVTFRKYIIASISASAGVCNLLLPIGIVVIRHQILDNEPLRIPQMKESAVLEVFIKVARQRIQ